MSDYWPRFYALEQSVLALTFGWRLRNLTARRHDQTYAVDSNDLTAPESKKNGASEEAPSMAQTTLDLVVTEASNELQTPC